MTHVRVEQSPERTRITIGVPPIETVGRAIGVEWKGRPMPDKPRKKLPQGETPEAMTDRIVAGRPADPFSGLTPGRVVHFTGSSGRPCLAATVAYVHPVDEVAGPGGVQSGIINLGYLSADGASLSATSVPYAPCEEPGRPNPLPETWHWPERAT